ncbi:hypothetical protein [Streptomyces sp. NPDC054786]
MYAALVLTAGASGLAVSSASAAPAAPPAPPTRPTLSVLSEIDSLGAATVPAKYQSQLPTVTGQLQHLRDLNRLHQVTDMAAPVTGLLPVG